MRRRGTALGSFSGASRLFAVIRGKCLISSRTSASVSIVNDIGDDYPTPVRE